MRLIIKPKNYHFKVYRSEDRESIAYTGEFYFNRKKDLLQVVDSGNRVVSTVRQSNYKWLQASWNCEYEINLVDDHIKYGIRCKNYWKQHWFAISEARNTQMDLYGHRWFKKSIYRGGAQIAGVDKVFVDLRTRDTILLDINNDENPILILTLVLLFEISTDSDDANINIGLGSIGQIKAYDETWEPI